MSMVSGTGVTYYSIVQGKKIRPVKLDPPPVDDSQLEKTIDRQRKLL